MSELSNEEIVKARIELQKARIEDLEKENAHYLEVIKKYEKEAARLTAFCQELEAENKRLKSQN